MYIFKISFTFKVPVHITLYGPAALTKTNRQNKNVKYNIGVYIEAQNCKWNATMQLDDNQGCYTCISVECSSQWY